MKAPTAQHRSHSPTIAPNPKYHISKILLIRIKNPVPNINVNISAINAVNPPASKTFIKLPPSFQQFHLIQYYYILILFFVEIYQSLNIFI